MLTVTEPAGPLTTASILESAFPPWTDQGFTHAAEQSVLAIAQGAEPRWIIVGDPRRVLPVLRNWRPYNLGSRLRWNGALLAASAGALSHLPGVIAASARLDFSYWRRSLPQFTENWSAVIHVGNPSHTRKAIVFFVDRDRRVKAVCKVPLTVAAASAILNEAAILLGMEAAGRTPQVFFRDEERGVAAQSWLDGEPVSRAFTVAHTDLLSRLATAGKTTRLSSYRPEIAARLDGIDLPCDRKLLARGLELLEFDEPLPAFLEHRDFAPWNLKRLSGGGLVLLDWEWAEPNGLPWQDACRYFYIQDALFSGPGRVWEQMTGNAILQRFCRQFAIPAHALRPLAMHYLLRVLAMDWQSGNRRLAEYTVRQIEQLLDHTG